MDAELWMAAWAYWTMMQAAFVLVAGVEWWSARIEGRASLGSGSERRMRDAQWSLAASHGRLQVMALMFVCWLMTSGIGWFCTARA